MVQVAKPSHVDVLGTSVVRQPLYHF
jgi:hypothetical protein